MYTVGASYYYTLRDELAGKKDVKLDDERGAHPASGHRRPEWLAVIGLTGLVVLIWLMVLKPG